MERSHEGKIDFGPNQFQDQVLIGLERGQVFFNVIFVGFNRWKLDKNIELDIAKSQTLRTAWLGLLHFSVGVIYTGQNLNF